MQPTFLIVDLDFLDLLSVIDSGNHPALPFFLLPGPACSSSPPSLLLPARRSVHVRCTCCTSLTVGMPVRSPSVAFPPLCCMIFTLHSEGKQMQMAFGRRRTEEGTDKRTSSISYEESELSYPLPSPFSPECPREEEEEVSLPPSEGCNNSLLLFFLWRWRAKTS